MPLLNLINMKKHTTSRRIPVKHVRDKAKAGYQKGSYCEVCGTEDNLQLHHFKSLTLLFEKWCRKNKLNIKTDEDVIKIRDDFIEQHYSELYEEVATLCKFHHDKLHSVYSLKPALATASKQANWIEKQRNKLDNVAIQKEIC